MTERGEVTRYEVTCDGEDYEDAEGRFVEYTDYAILERRFFKSNKAIAALEAEAERLKQAAESNAYDLLHAIARQETAEQELDRAIAERNVLATELKEEHEARMYNRSHDKRKKPVHLIVGSRKSSETLNATPTMGTWSAFGLQSCTRKSPANTAYEETPNEQ